MRLPPRGHGESPPSPSGASGSSPPAAATVPDFTRLSNGIPEISSRLSPDAPAVKTNPNYRRLPVPFSVSQALLKAGSRRAPGRAAAAPSWSRGRREPGRARGSHASGAAPVRPLINRKITHGHAACSREGLFSGLTRARGFVPAEQLNGDPGVTCARGTPRPRPRHEGFPRRRALLHNGVNRVFVSRDCTTPGKGKEPATSE